MKITKAVITSAGLGSRFLPAVKAYQKEMIPILEKPQLQYLIEEAIESGIQQIGITTFEGFNTVENYFTQSDDKFWRRLKSVGKEHLMEDWRKMVSSVEIRFFQQTLSHNYGNGTPILLAKEFVGDSPFYAMWGDDIMIKTDKNAKPMLEQLEFYYDKYNPVGVLSTMEAPLEIALKCGCFKFDQNSDIPNKVESMIEKPPVELMPSRFINASRFILTPLVIQELEKNIQGKDNEIWLTDAENRLMQQGALFIAPTWEGYEWCQVGDPVGWLKANILIAKNDERYKEKLDLILQDLK